LRAERREKAAVTIQTQIRGLLKRKEFQKYRHTVIVAQNLWRYHPTVPMQPPNITDAWPGTPHTSHTPHTTHRTRRT
jgi:hypothetical protein